MPRSRVGSAAAAGAASMEEDDQEEEDGEFGSLDDATTAAAAQEMEVGGGYGALDGLPRGPGHGQQYTMLRTPAAEYLDEGLFERLCTELTEYGRVHLGCD